MTDTLPSDTLPNDTLLTREDPATAPLAALEAHMPFVRRHVGPGETQTAHMVNALGRSSLDAVIDEAVPEVIRMGERLALPPALSEVEVVDELRALAAKNRPMVQMIGLGYYDTFTPAVIQRRVLENPGWYTAYTPYQPEISQGTARGAAELPDDDRGPHRAPDGQRLAPGRGDSRCRGDDDGGPGLPLLAHPRRRRRSLPADDRRPADAGASARHRGRRP